MMKINVNQVKVTGLRRWVMVQQINLPICSVIERR